MREAVLGLGAALFLVGCGGATDESPLGATEREARVLRIAAQVQRVFTGVGSDDSIGLPRSVPGGFAPEAIAAAPGAYRLIQINALGLVEPARVIQENGSEVTLALQSGPTAAFDGGVLTATRGFGDDLFTLNSQGVLSALRAGGGTLARRMESLDAQDQVVVQDFACTVTAAGTETIDLGLRQASLRRLDENCRGDRLIFDNIYWLDGAGEVIASRQYVSPSVAYLRSNRL